MLDLAAEEEDEEDDGDGAKPPPPPPADDAPPPPDDLPPEAEMTFQRARLVRKPTRYERKVDLDGIVEFVNDTHEQFVELWAGQYQRRLTSVLQFARRQKIVANEDVAAIEKLRLPGAVEVRKALQRYAMIQA